MELWDGYKADGSLAGYNMERGKPIPAGMFHIVVEVLVRHTDGTYLLMQRDWNKSNFPGLFEAGASGSVCKGEMPYEGALRELKEETGIDADSLMLVYVQSNMENTFYYGYLCVTNCGKDSIALQAGETVSYRWVDREEFLGMINGTDFVETQRERWLPFLDKV